jgi:hypothetical protein
MPSGPLQRSPLHLSTYSPDTVNHTTTHAYSIDAGRLHLNSCASGLTVTDRDGNRIELSGIEPDALRGAIRDYVSSQRWRAEYQNQDAPAVAAWLADLGPAVARALEAYQPAEPAAAAN